MNNENQSFESNKSKLRKLQALAEKGYKGEAEAAKRLLDKLCKQYGVSLEDILDQEKKNRYRFEIGKGKIWLDLFVQCYANVTGSKELRYIKESSSIIRGVELTAYEVAARYGIEIHTVHFSVVSTEENPKPHISARLSYSEIEPEVSNANNPNN